MQPKSDKAAWPPLAWVVVIVVAVAAVTLGRNGITFVNTGSIAVHVGR